MNHNMGAALVLLLQLCALSMHKQSHNQHAQAVAQPLAGSATHLPTAVLQTLPQV